MTVLVIVPTFDHGPTLRESVGSALAQTVDRLDVVIIGDGVPDEARAVITELCAADERVRFVDREKSPRTGEPYRNDVILGSDADVVCYLGDDDVWFPDHVETMVALLAGAGADFAYAAPLVVWSDDEVEPLAVDVSLESSRQLLVETPKRPLPLACGAHTVEGFRRLGIRWETTPTGLPTDTTMWRKFLAHPECRTAQGTRPTVVNLPSDRRRGWSTTERAAEMARWRARIARTDGRLDLVLAGYRHLFLAQARALADLHRHQEHADRLEALVEHQRAQLADLDALHQQADGHRRAAEHDCDAALAELRRIDEHRLAIHAALEGSQARVRELEDEASAGKEALRRVEEEHTALLATWTNRLRAKVLSRTAGTARRPPAAR